MINKNPYFHKCLIKNNQTTQEDYYLIGYTYEYIEIQNYYLESG